MTTNDSLAGRVALVAGATRGCGRAIATELGRLAPPSTCSGRTTRDGRSVMDRPETIEETAERVTAAGGTGIAVRCDHSDPADVRSLVDRIRTDHGRLDVLVNDVWGGDPFTTWGKTVWEHPLDATLTIVRNGIETHLITSHLAIPLRAREQRAAWSSRSATARATRPTAQRPVRPRQDRGRTARRGAGVGTEPSRRDRR